MKRICKILLLLWLAGTVWIVGCAPVRRLPPRPHPRPRPFALWRSDAVAVPMVKSSAAAAGHSRASAVNHLG